MRLFRASLAILVGLSLTLICQGHEMNDRHVGPHVSLLGENNVGHAQHAPIAAGAIHTEQTDYVTAHEPFALASSYSASLDIQQDVALGSTMLDVAHGVDSLSMQVVILLIALCCVLRRYSVAPGGQPFLATGTGSPPDHPPPRHISPSPAA